VVGSKKCSHHQFPQGHVCDIDLLENVKETWKPRKVYYWSPIIDKLQKNITDLQFRENIKAWRERKSEGDDIHDFRVWKEWSATRKTLDMS